MTFESCVFDEPPSFDVKGDSTVEMKGCLVGGEPLSEWQSVSKADDVQQARVVHDVDAGRSTITAMRSVGASKEGDEKAALQALAVAYSELLGEKVEFQWLDSAKGDYEDGFLLVPAAKPLGVQVRHFNGNLIAQLGKKAHVLDEPLRFSEELNEAIKSKAAAVTSATRASTILALYSPVPFGEHGRKLVTSHRFDYLGFREVWLCPFKETAFKLPPLNQ